MEVGEALYSQVIDKITVSSTRGRDGKTSEKHLPVGQYRARQ
jgi:hypothetical protein